MSPERDHRQDRGSAAGVGAAYLAEHEDRLAWIMGSSRSGSTWLLRMLSELDEAIGVDDPHIGHHLGVWRPIALAWATATERPELSDLRDLKRDKPDYFFSDRYRHAWMPALRELVRVRFGAQLDDEAPRAESPTVVVKEPGSHAAELIFEAFPRSRLVFLLRDGRDVVDSWLDAYQRGSWAIDEGAFDVAREGRLALVEWLSSVWAYRTRAVAAAYRGRPAGHRVMVRYEDLLSEPVTQLGRICAALGLGVSESRLAELADGHAFSRISSGRRGSGQEARSAEPGAWRRNLTAAERRAMNEVMGEQLVALGYERDRVAPLAA